VTNIGFNFIYEGTTYTQFCASSNGLMKLGSTTLGTGTWSNNIADNTTYPAHRPKIMPWWDDFSTGSNGGVHYGVFGDAPNRILVVRFRLRWTTLVSEPYNLEFQVRLYETTNKIEFYYQSGGTYINTVSCGIGGATATNYISVTAGASPSSSTSTPNNSNNTFPSANALYTFTPPVVCSSLTSAGTVTGNQTICSGGDPAAFSSTAAASGGSDGTIEYQWESSTTSSSSGYSDISGATSATYDVPSGLSATTYYRRKARRCGGSYEQTTSALTVTVIKATRDAPTGAQCSGTTLNFSAVPAGATTYAWTVRTNGTVTYGSGSGFTSNTSASVTSGSSASFSTALTNSTGADKTFYVDVSITANSTTCTQVFSPNIYDRTIYYSKSSGNLNDLSTWGINTDGSGCSPASFSRDGITYIIQNNTSPTTSASWAVSGTGSLVKVGDGSSAITFTAGAALSFDCDLEITANATLNLNDKNMTLSGDLIRSASTAGFNAGGTTGTVTFTGSSQNINVTEINGTTPTDSDITFNHVVIDGTDVKIYYLKTNDRKLNINNFTVNSGKVVTLYSNPQ
jgi:hypothetical protein